MQAANCLKTSSSASPTVKLIEMKLLLIIIVITSVMLSRYTVQSVMVRTPCDPNGFQCVNSTSFVICVDIGDNTFVPTPTIDNCPLDTICLDGNSVPCVQVTTKPPTSTTVPVPTTASPEFICTQHGKFAGPTCPQYYKCTKLVFWYIKTLNNCPFGLWFNQFSQLCVPPQLSKCE